MYFLVSPLFVIEILHRAVDIFEEYFNECNESSLKENYVIVYEVSQILIYNKILYPLSSFLQYFK